MKKYLRGYAPVLFFFFLFLLLFPLPQLFGKETQRKSAVVRTVEKIGPAVVNINTEEIIQRPANPFYSGRDDLFRDFFRDFSPRFQKQKKQSLGSGVIIDSAGHILTNHHVIARATSIKVTLIDKREYEATLIGADPRSDIAVIKINAKIPLPYAKMGRSDDIMIGETIIAIGNPYGLSHTVTTGVISAVGRDFLAPNKKVFTDFIQLDASINPGNSGGPLLNIEGDLIGINTAIYQKAEGIGFAIPIDRAKHIVKDLIQYGKVHKIWLGLFVQDMNPNIAAYFGMKPGEAVLVSKIFKGGSAEKIGLKAGDIILDIDGKRVKSKRGFFDLLSMHVPKQEISLTFSREGKVFKKEIMALKIPETQAKEIAMDWIGVEVNHITKEIFYKYRLQTKSGVVVTNVSNGGAAARVGIRPGDIVRQVNQSKIENLDDFKKAIIESWTKYSILLLIQRGPYGYYVALEP